MLSSWSRLRKLSYTWWALELAFVAVAVVLVTVSTVWREQDITKLDRHTLRRLTIKPEFLNREPFPDPAPA